MSKTPDTSAEDRDTMRPEYDFSGAVRGVTARRYAQGVNVVVNEGKIVFLHGINMTWYKGHEENIHAGKFDFAKKKGFGYEMYNFLDIDGRHYGYVALDDEHAIRLETESLGAPKSASSLDGVLAIWTAPCRDGRGREVVGWYRNATLHRYVVQPRGKVKRARTFTHPITRERIYMPYRVEANTKDSRLLRPKERVVRVGPYPRATEGIPGMSSIYYPFSQKSDEAKELRSRVLAFIEESDAGPSRSPRRGSTPGGQDQERKKRIEDAAVKQVRKHFGKGRNGLGYKIKNRQKDNVGYDLRMTKGDEVLCVEVKGRSTNDVEAEFSRNESGVIKEHERGRFEDGDYRVCIVTDALNEHDQRRLHHFSWRSHKKAWIEVGGSRELSFHPSGATVATLDEG